MESGIGCVRCCRHHDAEGKNLFQIYEWLRASQPDILRIHHAYFEKRYIESKTIEDEDQGRKLKKTRSNDAVEFK
jgi:hypothetical protein